MQGKISKKTYPVGLDNGDALTCSQVKEVNNRTEKKKPNKSRRAPAHPMVASAKIRQVATLGGKSRKGERPLAVPGVRVSRSGVRAHSSECSAERGRKRRPRNEAPKERCRAVLVRVDSSDGDLTLENSREGVRKKSAKIVDDRADETAEAALPHFHVGH